MENNQQNRHTEYKPGAASAAQGNERPGQQLPTEHEAKANDVFAETGSGKEQHSESSKPENPNETLGTP